MKALLQVYLTLHLEAIVKPSLQIYNLSKGVFNMEQCFSSNLKELMKSNKVTQDRLAEIAGVSRQSVNQWLNKETLPTLQSVLAISSHFNLSVENLIYNDQSIHDSTAIPRRFFPICTGVQDNKIILEQVWSEAYMIANNIPIDADFCFIMYDNSMWGNRIRKGDIIVIKKTKTVKPNHIVLCILNGMLVLRKYTKSKNGNDIMLICSNDKYPNYVITEKDKCELIGIATVFRSRL